MRHGAEAGYATIESVQSELLRTFPLKSTNSARTWEGVHVSEFAEVHIEDLISAPRDHVKIGLCIGTSPYIRREACGKTMVGSSRVGEFSLLPPGRKSRWHGLVPAHLDIRLDPAKMDEMAAEFSKFGEPRFDFVDIQRMRDPLIEHLGAVFREELNYASHPAQDLTIGSLALALCAHLLRGYTNAVGIEQRSTVAVEVAAVRRAIAYIRDNPDRAISLQDLAAAAGLSRFHFSRVFKHEVGMSPARYVERTRIEQAKRLIVDGDLSLANVAQAVGFADQSHFSRRFRFHEGRSPAAFAREQGRGVLPPR